MLRFGNISEIDVDKCFARVKFIDDGIVSDFLQIIVMGAINNKYFHMLDINEQVACLMDENSEEGVILGAVFNNKTNPDGGNKDIVRIKFSDNSSIEYNRSTHEYNIDIKGKINIKSDSEVNIDTQTAKITVETAEINADSVAVNATDVDVEATNVTVNATNTDITSIVSITGETTITGNLTVSGIGTFASISAGSAGATVDISGGNIDATGDVTTNGKVIATGDITTSGDVKAGLITLKTHKHIGVTTGAGTSGIPTP